MNQSPWKEQLQKHHRLSEAISALTRPLLEMFQLSHFSYFSVDDAGYSACISTHPEWMEFYLDQQLFCNNPFLKDPAIIPSGVFFTKAIKDPKYLQSRQHAHSFGIEDSLVITTNIGNRLKGFSFGWRSEVANELTLINEIPLLKRYCQFFEEQAEKAIRDVESDPIHVLPMIGEKFYRSKEKFIIPQNKRSSLLSLLGVESPQLSNREKECLRLCLSGETAKGIASILHLSTRTVESYFENIKIKLNCFNKTELLKKAKDLQDCGLLGNT
jgi:DNA-binding CsgD family transcriptional regulator